MNNSSLKVKLKALMDNFDSTEEVLRDILQDCNLDYMSACRICKEIGIKQKTTNRKQQYEINSYQPPVQPNMELTSPYNTTDIDKLCELFPQYSRECLAAIYWDTKNNVEKTINRIIGNGGQYKQESNDIEFEYLKLAYSFLPESKVSAAFLMSNSNYLKCVSYIESQYKSIIRQHWNEYMNFKNQYGGLKHSYVVSLFRQKTVYSSNSPIIEDEEIYYPAQNKSVDYLKVLSRREDASACLTNARILNAQRAENSRGYNKYLTGPKAAVDNEIKQYYAINQESGNDIFKAHNGDNSITCLIKNNIPIDFHGLQVREVAQYMNQVIAYTHTQHTKHRVTIITGSGNHSKDNVSPIRLYVMNRLRQEMIEFSQEGGQLSFRV